MGGGGKGTTSTTQTMQIPPEVMARYNAVNARAETVAQKPYQAYSQDPNAFVAPLTQTQQAGIQNTNTMAGAAQPYYQTGALLTGMGAQGANPGDLNVGQYYNPFTQAVAAPTLQALQQQQAVARSSLMNPQTARSFGGDRSGLVAANLAQQQDLATAQAMAPIYQNAYSQALAAAQQQQGVGLAAQQANLGRLMQAGQQFGTLGAGAQQAGLAGAQAQLGAGQVEQQTQQAGLQALYNQFQQQQAYPFQIAQFLANIAEGTGALSGNTTTSNTTGGGGFFSSDERLKENIQKVGETNDGQNIYRYNYKGDPRTQIGLLAQEVAKDHPEAVGQSGGYLTVNYRDATDDAVRGQKADGGDVGTSAYDIAAPVAKMGLAPVTPSMLAGLATKPMVGLGGLSISPSATAPGAAGILAPKATGLSPGSIESAQAHLASLRGADMSKSQSSADYFDQQRQKLEDFLAANGASSQGGLVVEPGHFASGGYAEGGYTNPALQYYGPNAAHAGLGAGGPYGAQLTPAQVQALRAPEISRPQPQKSGIEQANQIASMATKGYEAWKARPDFLRTKEDIALRNQASGAPAQKVSSPAPAPAPSVSPDNLETQAGTVILPFEPPQAQYRGGLVQREHHAGLGPVGGTPYGSSDQDNPLGEALTSGQQHYEMMQPGKINKPAPQPSGAQQMGQAANLGLAGKKAYDFAAKKLATDAVTPGLASGAEAAATPIAEAAAAPVAEGLAAAAPAAAAEGAGLVGTLGAGAAAAGEGLMAALPFLAFLSDKRAKHDIEHVGTLNDGQPVYRFKYNGDDKTRMGLIAQDVEKEHPEAVKGLGGAKMVDYKAATNAAARQHHADGERVEDTSSDGVMSKVSSALSDAGDTVSGLGKKIADNVPNSPSFWVPAIAGLGAMLASPNKTLAGAIGSGLVGGATAYEGVQKLNADQIKQRYDIAKSVFRGPVMNSKGEWTWEDTRTGEMLSQPEYQRRYSGFVGGMSSTPSASAEAAPKAEPSVTATAKKVVSEPAPEVAPKPVKAVSPPAPAAGEATGATTPAAPAAPAAPAVAAKKAEAQAPKQENVVGMLKSAYDNTSLWENVDASRNPRILLPQVAQIDAKIAQLEAQAQQSNDLAAAAADRNPDQGKLYQARAQALLTQSGLLRKERDDKAAAADKALRDAIALQSEEAKLRLTKNIEREAAAEKAPSGETVLMPQGAQMPPATAPAPTEAQKSAPKTAQVDPATGQLVLARPVAPAGGGLIVPNLPPGAKVTEISPTAKNQNAMDEQFQKDFMEKAPSVGQARQRYMGLVNAFKMFESGSTEGTRAGWAAILQTLGYPDMASKFAAGDPAAVQWVEKTGPNLVLDTLKAATPRFAQSEFTTLQNKGTPEPNKLPQANFQMVKEGLATLNRTDAFMQAWQRASQEEGWRSPSAYYMAWSKANPPEAFEKAAERQMGNFAGMGLPPASEWTPGTVYVVPNNLSAKVDPKTGKSQKSFFEERGLKPGDAFQYNGPDAPRELIIKPVPKQQLFSTPVPGQ